MEAQMLQSLSDLDSVVKVLDYFEANNTAYLVMEYLDGRSLKDHVEKIGKLDAQIFLKQMQPLMADMDMVHFDWPIFCSWEKAARPTKWKPYDIIKWQSPKA